MPASATKSTADTEPIRVFSRWLVAAAAVVVQLSLGGVYAWSVFRTTIQELGYARGQATLPFTVTIGVLFVGTFIGGRLSDRMGPKPVAVAERCCTPPASWPRRWPPSRAGYRCWP